MTLLKVSALAVILSAAPCAVRCGGQMLPTGLPERLDSGEALQRPILAASPGGYTLAGSTRITAGDGSTSLPVFVYAPDGALHGSFVVDSGTTENAAAEPSGRSSGSSGNFSVAGRANDDFLFVWSRITSSTSGSGSEIVAQQYSPGGEARGEPEVIAGADGASASFSPAVACNRTGRCAVAWLAQAVPGGATAILGDYPRR